jgi:hypothetical protein
VDKLWKNFQILVGIAVDMGSSSSYDLFVKINYFQLIHLLAFSFWFGMLQWNTWIAGIVSIKNLPRHMFGNLQR